MEDLKEILETKLINYLGLYGVARELNQIDNCKYYTKYIDKLEDMLNILNK